MAVTTSGWRISPAPPFPSLSSPTQNLTYKPINIVVRRVSASITLSSSTKSKSKSKPKRACLFAVSELVEDTSETHPQSEPTGANIDIKLPRRSLLVQFTCNVCGERTKRLVNQLAYERGLIYVQCAGCLRHHKLVDNLGLMVEYDLREEINPDSNTDQV